MSRNKHLSSRLDLLSLRLLVAAIEEGNLARVAELQNIALSGVSRRITDIELRWGVQLLHRHDRGVRPTAAAEAIVDRLKQVFGLLDDVMDDVAGLATGTQGILRLHVNMTAVAGDLANHLAEFSAAHPQIVIELEEATTLDTIQTVRLGRCDIGIISGTVNAEGLYVTPWMDDELVAILPYGHSLASRPSLRLEDFLDYPFVGMQHNSALQMLYRAKATELGGELNERSHVSSFSAAVKLVAAGCGLSILPRVAVNQQLASLVAIKRLDEPWALRQVMLCMRSSQFTPLQRTFMDFLKALPGKWADNEQGTS